MTPEGLKAWPGAFKEAARLVTLLCMNELRRRFIEAAERSRELLSRDEVRAHWDGPSALKHFSVRGLAGHLVRATGSVEAYLDRPEPPGDDVISAAAYYAAAVDKPDLQSELHVAVRARGEAEAAGGYDGLVQRLGELIERLKDRLDDEPPDRLVSVFKGLVLTLDDYLVTRLIEQVVHCDDLAISVGVDGPEWPRATFDVALGALLDVARSRHGDVAVMHAFARRERDSVDALRVL